MVDGFALSLQVVRYPGSPVDSARWWASVNMRAGMHGSAASTVIVPLPAPEDAMRMAEGIARSLGHRLIELGTPAEPGPDVPVHQCPSDGSGIMPCCGRTPFELRAHRVTVDPQLVTCPGRSAKDGTA